MAIRTQRPREKRPNGEGGIWYSQTEGRWWAQYADQQGRLRNLSARTEAEVTRKLDEAISRRDAGMLCGLPSNTPTLGASGSNRWVRSMGELRAVT